MANKTCVTQGFDDGTLTCSASCAFVTTDCISDTTGGGDDGGSTGGGASGGAAAVAPPAEDDTQQETLPEQSKTFATITQGEPAVFAITNANIYNYISEITINSNTEASNVKVTVKKHNSRPSSVSSAPSKSVYKYLEINLDNLDNTALDNAELKFSVEKIWLSANNIDKNTVILLRYNSGSWNELPTSFRNEETNYIHYIATTPGFSVFAIAGEPSAAQSDTPSIDKPVDQPDDIKEITGEAITETSGGSSLTTIVIILLVLVVGGAVMYFIGKKKKSSF